MIQYLPAILIIGIQLAIWAFYALFAVAGVVLAKGCVLLAHAFASGNPVNELV
jgi:hypothetical protein